ncbi:hypothetical protein MMC22_006963 [Lobaria immixta]|nr:hypothetical protein [Lobaria immixta]
MPPKRKPSLQQKPPLQRRRPLHEATPSKLNTSAAVENPRNDSEKHSVGKLSREDRENHPIHSKNDRLRKVLTGRCGNRKVAKLKSRYHANIAHAGRGTREFIRWPKTKNFKLWLKKERLKKEEFNKVDALRQELKLTREFCHPVPDIEIASNGSIRWCREPRDCWKMETKEENIFPISSFTLRASSSRAERDRSVDTKVCCGDFVELKSGGFIRILEIYRPPQRSPVQIRGHLFERNMRLMGWLPRIENEVFWLWTFPMGQDRESAEALVVEARSSEVLRKWDLQMDPPRVRQYNSPSDKRSSSEQVQDNITRQGTLICSWKYVRGIDEEIFRTQFNETFDTWNYDEKSLIAVAATDSHEGVRSSYSRCDGQGLSTNPVSGKDDSSYTFGDAFAGCGGMSRAAVMAELEVKWGFDMNPIAMEAYRRNFPNADARLERADEFVASGTDAKLKVDILHFSPPCQCFCGANAHKRKPAQDQNSAALFALPEIMKKTDPRIVIIEQVQGLIVDFAEYFGALVQFFTYRGWSIRWKVINCIDFGVRQKGRHRLFMIGSRPGTDLPKFPLATHTEDDVEKPLCDTIMATKLKGMTIPEVAEFQSFPPEHKFHGTRKEQQCQIGNAVPPLVGQAILKEVKRSLMRTDGIYSNGDAPDPDDRSNILEAPCEKVQSLKRKLKDAEDYVDRLKRQIVSNGGKTRISHRMILRRRS